MSYSSCAIFTKRAVVIPAILAFLFSGLANAETPWEAILSENVGYGGNSTGGAGGQLITVTNLNDSGTGSLRAALAVAGIKWIRFSPGLEGTIELSKKLDIPSNTTIDGRGADITLDWGGEGYGTYLGNISNIVLMYLKLQNGQHDLVHLRNGFSDAWIHHVTFGLTSDEQLSIRNGADRITVSWCRFDYNNKGALMRQVTEGDPYNSMYSHVTFHHNFWNSVNQRTPKLSNVGHYHIFNDYVFEWDYAAVRAIQNGEVLIESSIFDPKNGTTKSGELRAATPYETGVTNGLMRLKDNLFMDGAFGAENDASSVFIPPYAYVKDEANQQTRDAIVAGAGWQDVPFPDSTAQASQPQPPGAFGAQ